MIINIHVTFGSDGRMKFKSPDVPGLFLASRNLGALARDLDEATRDLLRLNLGLTPEKIEFRFCAAPKRSRFPILKRIVQLFQGHRKGMVMTTNPLAKPTQRDGR